MFLLDAAQGWRLESLAAGLPETITVLKLAVPLDALREEVSRGWEEVTLLARSSGTGRSLLRNILKKSVWVIWVRSQGWFGTT